MSASLLDGISASWGRLPGGFTAEFRAALRHQLSGLLRWQRELRDWPEEGVRFGATPFVSLYAHGRLCGCYGASGDIPSRRVARAFLRALHDGRFGPPTTQERTHLSVQLSVITDGRVVSAARLEDEMRLGIHGLASGSGRHSAILLPHVANDAGHNLAGFIRALEAKRGAPLGADTPVYMFETADIVVRTQPDPDMPEGDRALWLWLERLIEPSGRIAFGVCPKTGVPLHRGRLRHARVASVLSALHAKGCASEAVARGRTWLCDEVLAGLSGDAAVLDWPDDPARIAGTVALAALAGVPCLEELRAYVRREDVLGPLGRSAWQSSQVVAALGLAVPDPVWGTCERVAKMSSTILPWFVPAVRARKNKLLEDALETVLVRELKKAEIRDRRSGAFSDGAWGVPLTALVCEVLLGSQQHQTRTLAKGVLERLLSQQASAKNLRAALDPAATAGAVPLSRTVDIFRADATAHLGLAMLQGESLT